MSDTQVLVPARSRLRGLFADRRRLVAALAVADSVLVPAALVVWLPLLGPDAAPVPSLPSTSPPARPVTTRPELPAPPPLWEQPAPPVGESGDVPPWFPTRPTEAATAEPSPAATTPTLPSSAVPGPEPTVPVTEPPEPTPTDGTDNKIDTDGGAER